MHCPATCPIPLDKENAPFAEYSHPILTHKALSIERPKGHNDYSIANLNTLIYLVMNVRADYPFMEWSVTLISCSYFAYKSRINMVYHLKQYLWIEESFNCGENRAGA